MLLFGAVTPLTDVWTSETREKQVKETKKKTNIFFFVSKTFYHEGAPLSELPVTKASSCWIGRSEYPDPMIGP